MRLPSSLGLGFALVSVLAVVPACTSDEPATNLGVNDVRKACELRQQWKAISKETCLNCRASAPLADCGCETFKDFAAKCVAPQDAVKAEPSCTNDVNICVKTCLPTDCDCLDRCYASAETCKRVSGGLDGCITDVCAPYCN